MIVTVSIDGQVCEERAFVYRHSRWSYLSAVSFSEDMSVPTLGWGLNCAGTLIGRVGRPRRQAAEHLSCFVRIMSLMSHMALEYYF